MLLVTYGSLAIIMVASFTTFTQGQGLTGTNFRESFLLLNPKSKLGLPEESTEDWNRIWLRTKVVPNYVSNFPTNKLYVRFNNGIELRPNDTVTTGLMVSKPTLLWPTDPVDLYTVIMINADIDQSLKDNGGGRRGKRVFVHWMVSNVVEVDMDNGTTVLPYIPSLTVRDFEGQLDQNPEYKQCHLFLVYRQKSNLIVRAKPECNSKTVSDRLVYFSEFLKMNGLEGPVAGNFLRNLYTGFVTDTYLCSLSRCAGRPFPTLIQGVNSQSYCQPSLEPQGTFFKTPNDNNNNNNVQNTDNNFDSIEFIDVKDLK